MDRNNFRPHSPVTWTWASTLCLVLLLSACGPGIDQASRTATAVCVLRVQINKFVASHGRAPESLEELAEYAPRIHDIKDGWGHTLLYRVDSSGVGVITSQGRHKQASVGGKETDLVWTFALKDASGHWIGTNAIDGAVSWISQHKHPDISATASIGYTD